MQWTCPHYGDDFGSLAIWPWTPAPGGVLGNVYSKTKMSGLPFAHDDLFVLKDSG
jgi:hypothetical protein